MACALTQSYTPRDCKAPAGVVGYYLIEYANVTAMTITANVVTAITKATGKVFRKYSQEAETADWKYSGTSDAKMGSFGYDIEANFQTYGLDTTLNAEIELLIKNKLLIIAEMNDGQFYLLGKEYGMHVVTDSFESGVAFGDFQGDKIQLKGRATTKAPKVDSTIIAGLLV